jgi:hypothetical protein
LRQSSLFILLRWSFPSVISLMFQFMHLYCFLVWKLVSSIGMHCPQFSLIFFPSVMTGLCVVFVGLGHSGICVLFIVCCLTHL